MIKTIFIKNNFLFILLTFFLLLSFICKAQFFDELSNPKVAVNIVHPPSLGLNINKVAFNNAKGNCADQIINEMISDFVNNNVEVIDRQNLETILSEHDLNFSGYIDKTKAISMGQILGPSALVSVNVLRCETEIKDNLYKDKRKYNSKTDKYYTARQYIANTRVFLKVSIQVTDLTTGTIFSAKQFDYSPMLENTSYSGKPVAPSEFDVQEIAFGYLISDVHKMFFSWIENTELYFFDDMKGGLKEAYNSLKRGDNDKAFQLSKENLEECKNDKSIKDKILAHAYYNLGMMYFISNDFDNAIINLEESEKIRPGKIVSEAIENCNKAKLLHTKMEEVNEHEMIQIEEQSKLEQSRKSNLLTNADIIDLTEKKLPNSLIIQKINTSECNFDTSTDALLELTNKGVAEEVIILMMEK